MRQAVHCLCLSLAVGAAVSLFVTLRTNGAESKPNPTAGSG